MNYLRFGLAVLRWLAVMIVLALGALTAPIVYPLAYLLRAPLRVINLIPYLRYLTLPLYIYLDDEDFENPPVWWLRAKGLKMDSALNRFWSAYRWNGFRNTIWNFHLLTEHDHSKAGMVYSKGLLFKNFEVNKNPFDFAVLKYVNQNGEYTDNNGDFLSIRFSIIGRMFCVYEYKGNTFFRYSFAKKLPLLGWTELQMGTNDKRYTFRFKIKGDVPVYPPEYSSYEFTEL